MKWIYETWRGPWVRAKTQLQLVVEQQSRLPVKLFNHGLQALEHNAPTDSCMYGTYWLYMMCWKMLRSPLSRLLTSLLSFDAFLLMTKFSHVLCCHQCFCFVFISDQTVISLHEDWQQGSMSGSTLSPWDLSGLGMGFGLYRPRRPSYTFATQHSRQRSESYRYATRRDPDGGEAQPQEDYIENVLSKVRKESYLKATRDDAEGNHVELSRLTENHMTIVEEGAGNDALCESQNHINQKFAAQNCRAKSQSRQASVDTLDAKLSTTAGTPSGGDPTPSIISAMAPTGWCSGQKNLIVLCVSFIFIFSPFRGVQNLQSSLNAEDQLGIIAMSCLHGTMVMTCFLAPLWTNVFTAKWTLALGALCFLLWFGANFYPTFYTLIPAAVVTGFGHGLLWTAESSYLLKLAFDLAHITRDQLEPKMFRFHAIFLACFQTTHIWGNLISSLLLGHRTKVVQQQVRLDIEAQAKVLNMTVEELESYMVPAVGSSSTQCGVLYRCQADEYIAVFPDKPYGESSFLCCLFFWPFQIIQCHLFSCMFPIFSIELTKFCLIQLLWNVCENFSVGMHNLFRLMMHDHSSGVLLFCLTKYVCSGYQELFNQYLIPAVIESCMDLNHLIPHLMAFNWVQD